MLIKEGELIEHSTEDFTLLKGVHLFRTHDCFIPSRFVPKFIYYTVAHIS